MTSSFPDPFAPATPSEPAKKKQFRLPGWTLIAVLALLAVLLFRVNATDSSTDPSASQGQVIAYTYAIGAFIAALFFAFIISIVVFYAAKRSERAATAAFLVALCTAGLRGPILGALSDRRTLSAQSNSQIETFAQQTEDRKAELLKELNETGDIKNGSALAAETHRMLTDASKSAQGQEKILFEAIAIIAEQSSEASKAFEASLDRLIAAGSVSPASIKAKTEIADRRLMLDQVRSHSVKLGNVVFGAPDEIHRLLREKGVSAKKADEAKKGFVDGMRLPAQRKMRKTDLDLFKAMDTQLDVLERSWGKWQATDDGGIIFEHDRDLEDYNAAVAAMDKAMVEQEEAQRTLLAPK